MPVKDKDLRAKIAELTREVATLTSRVELLESHLDTGSRAARDPISADGDDGASRELQSSVDMSMGGMAALMSRLTAVTLILLLALVLRTLTDSGSIGTTLGTLLGITYASFLEGTGWVMYRRSHSFAPIFSVSGALLLFAVVLEAHSRFGSIPSVAAYGILIVAAGGMTVMGHMHRAGIPVIAGTMGITIAGILMELPDPNFPHLAVFLLGVNVLTFSAVNLPRCWWLRQVSFLATVLVYGAWLYKLGSTTLSSETPAGATEGSWFIPAITVTSAFYIFYAFLRIPRRKEDRIGRFDSVLPALATVWAYLLARGYLPGHHKTLVMLGASGAAAAVLLLAMAFFIVSRREEGAAGINTLVFPAAFLLALSFRDLSGESVIALATLSLAGYGLTYLSVAWRSAGVRVTSYFLQATVVVAAYMLLLGDPPGTAAVLTILSMSTISAVTFLHYRRMRKIDPPQPSEFFTRVDKGDRSAVVLLLTSLGTAFLALRAGAHEILGAGTDAFICSQTVLINAGAAGLFLKGYRLRRKEIRNVAVLVTFVGALKVFAMDLFGVKGLPLVISVLSFGLTAALGSIILGRWHRSEGEPPPSTSE